MDFTHKRLFSVNSSASSVRGNSYIVEGPNFIVHFICNGTSNGTGNIKVNRTKRWLDELIIIHQSFLLPYFVVYIVFLLSTKLKS